MPKLSAEVIKARIDALQKQLALAHASKAPAIRKVKALMKKLGVTVADLGAEGGAKRRGRPAKAAKGDANLKSGGAQKLRKSRGKVAIKYKDDKGNVWTGRGKTPRWMVAAEKSGAKRESFLIK